MKKLRNLIIFLAILIVLLLIAIIILNYNKQEITDINNTLNNIGQNNQEIDENGGRTSEAIDEDMLETIPENEEITSLTNALYYFVVKDCMQQYVKTINIESSVYYGYDENGNYVNTASEIEKKERIYNLLSSKYIEKHNITIDNIYNYINVLKEDLIFVPVEIKEFSNSDKVKSFVIYGLLESNNDYSLQGSIYSIVNIDDTNLTYSIEPVENIDSIDKISVTKIENNINNNDDENTYTYQSLLDEDFAKEYMLNYKRLSIGNPELMYQKLNVEYRNKRFGSLENFKKYVNENHDKIYSTNLLKYLVEDKNGYKQYVLLDQNNNYYIFQETSPMKYTVILDTYTVDLPEFLEKYNEADEQLKVKMNINRFFEAIKLNDYKYAYTKLDDSFKAQYFATFEEFENYAKTNLIYEDEIEYNEFSDLEGVYTYTVELTNGENIVEKTITMQLLEETDYRLSFNIM